MVVVAINMNQSYGIPDWKEYWGRLGAADVIWAQDTNHTAASFEVTSSGTNIIINRSGSQVYKKVGPIMYPDLMSELEKLI